MNIELWQLLTHAIGFLIVVGLLKKYAWGPILDLIEERREKIAGDFREIELQKKDVESLRNDYVVRMKEIESEKRQKLVEGVNEGQEIANELKSKAQTEARGIITRAEVESERELVKARVQLKDDMIRLTIGAAEKILGEKLDAEKDRQLVSGYIDQLENA
ncbi:MAG: F0F1 ATP synthase subunit B [candidate division Zixibacteria bacterium]|nr:F0F1 ATP synthase subunit B [candidate division Zixibacteria bacterium]